MRARPTYEGKLGEGWEQESQRWVDWVRRPGHDSYWRFHRDQFFALLPAPGRRTVDVGCGEGRVARDLSAAGHHVVALDRSPGMVRAAAAGGTPDVVLADSARLPLAAEACDLAVAFMSLQDMDDMPGAVAEMARVLEPGGRLCLAVVHPLNALGQFESREPDARFVIEGDYFERRGYTDTAERDGLAITFHQHHWTLGDYFGALESAGLLTERVREATSPQGLWQRMPLFLHVRAIKR